MDKRQTELWKLQERIVALLPQDQDEAMFVVEAAKAKFLSRHEPATDSGRQILSAMRGLETMVLDNHRAASLVSLASEGVEIEGDADDAMIFAIAEADRRATRLRDAYAAALGEIEAALAA